MRKIVIAGGPHTGKSTLLEHLQGEFAGKAHFIPEPAALLIDAENKKRVAQPGYEPIFPTNRYREFAGLVVAKSVELEAAIPPDTVVTVLDRSLIDNIGYARMNDCHDLVPGLRSLAVAARYSTVLMCDFVGQYQQTDIRIVDEGEAHRIHDHMLEAYGEFDVDIVHLPPVSVEARLAIARSVIEAV